MNKLVEIAETFLGASSESKRALIDYYNDHCISLVKPSRKYQMKYDDEWCAMFTSVVAHLAGMSRETFPYEVSVREQCNLARDRGQYFKGAGDCFEGDLIVYDWLGNGGYNHVGFVVNADSERIKALEGNIGDTVGYRTVNRHSRVVKGIIRLGNTNHSATDSRVERLAMKVLKGELGNGDARRVALGADYMAVQNMVNKLLAE